MGVPATRLAARAHSGCRNLASLLQVSPVWRNAAQAPREEGRNLFSHVPGFLAQRPWGAWYRLLAPKGHLLQVPAVEARLFCSLLASRAVFDSFLNSCKRFARI